MFWCRNVEEYLRALSIQLSVKKWSLGNGNSDGPLINYSGASRISPKWGANPRTGCQHTRFCQILSKTAWNWKNLDPRGIPRKPPLRSANALLVKDTMETGADPGFSVVGAPTYKFARFSQKLHEIEKSLGRKGEGARVRGIPLVSATGRTQASGRR